MTGAGTGDGLPLIVTAVRIFNGKRLGPILPILVFKQDCDGGSDGFGVTDAAHDVGLVGLNLHAAAASEPLLATPQFAIQGGERDGNARGQAGENRDQGFAV